MVEGRATLITGGAEGIGKETCLQFALRGAHVVCGDLNEHKIRELEGEWEKIKAREKENPLGARLGTLSCFHCDLATSKGAKDLVAYAVSLHGTVDVLFNNVGIQPEASRVPLHQLSEATWDQVMNVNLKSCFWICREAIPFMLRNPEGGSIINNASIQGIQSQKNVAVYAASKGALLSLTRQLACEYGGSKIRVNSVSPGSIGTELMRENTPDLDNVIGNTPAGRIGEARDVAGAVLFLAGREASWITGHNLVVDGGITVKGGWAKL